jgi:hypothetical protein
VTRLLRAGLTNNPNLCLSAIATAVHLTAAANKDGIMAIDRDGVLEVLVDDGVGVRLARLHLGWTPRCIPTCCCAQRSPRLSAQSERSPRLRRSRAIRPFIFQLRREYAVSRMNSITDEAVFNRREFRCGVAAAPTPELGSGSLPTRATWTSAIPSPMLARKTISPIIFGARMNISGSWTLTF